MKKQFTVKLQSGDNNTMFQMKNVQEEHVLAVNGSDCVCNHVDQ